MNTASTLRSSLIAALLIAAPTISHANSAPTSAAMDACISAFISTSLEKERPYTVHKDQAVDSALDQHARTFRIALTATGKNSGKRVAKATCVVDRAGAVLTLNGKPYGAATMAQSTARNAR